MNATKNIHQSNHDFFYNGSDCSFSFFNICSNIVCLSRIWHVIWKWSEHEEFTKYITRVALLFSECEYNWLLQFRWFIWEWKFGAQLSNTVNHLNLIWVDTSVSSSTIRYNIIWTLSHWSFTGSTEIWIKLSSIHDWNRKLMSKNIFSFYMFWYKISNDTSPKKILNLSSS